VTGRFHRLAVAGALAAAVTAAAPSAAGAAVGLKAVATFSSPVFVTAPSGDERRLFVVEKRGRIRVFRDGAKLSRAFLDISALVAANGERGLLALEFPPDYASTRRFYVFFNDVQGDIRVEEFLRSRGSADVADPASRRLVLEIPHRDFSNHNGGQLEFGPDGLLYISTGDGGGAFDPLENAQNLGSLLGKVLRIDPRTSGTAPYRVPSDNPFVGRSGARPEVYAYGLRNPFRFSFDRSTGDIAIGDVGQSAVEEIDFARRGGARGANYGWDTFEGSRSTGEGGGAPGHVPPVLERFHTQGDCSIIAGYVVRDRSLPSLLGRFLHGDFCLGRLRSAVLGIPRARDDRALGPAVDSLASFGEDGNGCLYAVSLAGPVYRLVESSREVPCPAMRVRAPTPQLGVRGRKSVLGYARCSVRCTVAAVAILRVGSKTYKLTADRETVAAGQRARLDLGLSRFEVGRVFEVLARGGLVRARIRFRARDSFGKPTAPQRRRVRVRG
jgi:glucose/arabinose dehydrogenase